MPAVARTRALGAGGRKRSVRWLGHPLVLGIPFAAAVALEATLFGVFAPPEEGGHGAGHGASAGPESLEPLVAVAAVLTAIAALAFPVFVRSFRGREEAAPVGWAHEGLALLSASVAAIHFAVVSEHFDEFALFGVLFAATAILQLVWAALVLQRPSRPVLLMGAIGNGGVASVWLLSRIAGLPVGPEPWTPEPVGIGDVVATVLEVGLVVGALALLRGDGLGLAPRAGRTASWALALTLVPLTSIALLAATGVAF